MAVAQLGFVKRQHTTPMKPFDWWGFGVRGFCGGLLGALIGWRAWIRLYANRDLQDSWTGLIVCVGVGFVLVGVIVGLSKPPDFWGRP